MIQWLMRRRDDMVEGALTMPLMALVQGVAALPDKIADLSQLQGH